MKRQRLLTATVGAMVLGGCLLANYGPSVTLATAAPPPAKPAGDVQCAGCIDGTDLGTNVVTGANVLDKSLTAADIKGIIISPSPDNNTAIGEDALKSNILTGQSNTASGVGALEKNSTGFANTASGVGALLNNTEGHSNTVSGVNALGLNTTGHSNTVSGVNALVNNTTGFGNTAIGTGAGSDLTAGDNNIYVNNSGVAAESNTIRIGQAQAGVQTATYIAGIDGTVIGAGTTVLIDSHGQLGTVVSSRRFKDEIREMAEASGGLLKLRPVTFRYKQASANGTRPFDYGLIAEEVAEVYPDLVTHNTDGQIESVQYHKLVPMLLNELQKQHRLIEDLTARLARLEAVSQRESGLVTAEAK